METLDELVTQAQGLSGRRDDLSHLLGLLQSKGAEVLSRSSQADLEQVLPALDPAAHSLACLFVLDTLTATASRSFLPPCPRPLSSPASAAAEQVVTSVSSFIALCSQDQIRLEPAKFCALCRRLKDALLALGPEEHSIRGVPPLLSALRKLQPSAEHITPIHADFLQLCLLARCHAHAYRLFCAPDHAPAPGPSDDVSSRDVTEQLICQVEPHETAVTQTDFLLFCYYGGMVCIGMRKLDQAARLLLHAVTAPAVGLSAITIAAYKKYLLLTLILQGKVSPLPRYTPSVVQRQLKGYASEYVELAEAYPKRNAQELQEVISKHEDAFRLDSNLGLVKQVLVSLYKRSILRLTQTYLTLSLESIVETVKLKNKEEAERYIRRMIEDGEIHASISQKDGMVSFQQDPERYNTFRMADIINSHISRTIQLNRKLEDTENSLACDRQYLHRIHMREKAGRYVDPDEIDFGGGPSRVFESPM